MNKWLIPLCTLLLVTGSARAVDVGMDANLVSPSSTRPWINQADCVDDASREALVLHMSWSVPATVTTYLWDNAIMADAFISSSETCATVTFEIGDTAEDGGDVEIEPPTTTTEGSYPATLGDYTLLDLIADSDFDCGGSTEGAYYLCLAWEDEILVGLQTQTYGYYAAAPIRIDLVAPGAPILTAVNPGEKNLKLEWEPPEDDDLGGFFILYREVGAEDWQFKTVTSGDATSYQISGLTNGVAYEVYLTAYDEAENEGAESETRTGTPTPIQDFFEYYKEQGGSEKGGFCFVATAAYGSYDDAMVQPLRRYRDQVLAKSVAGRAATQAYYRFGPRWARAIREQDSARAVARWSLMPAVGVAFISQAGPAEWLVLGAGLFILGLLILRFRRWLSRLVRRVGPAVLAVVVGLGALGGAGSARAMDEQPGDVPAPLGGDPSFQLQFRFGPYYPDVDKESGMAGVAPFKSIFGGSTEMLFELGLDYEFWRGFGAFSAGVSVGFVQYLGKGRTEDGQVSTDTTVFNLVPCRLTVGYHFTKLEEWWQIPVVPYVQGGLSYYFWWVTDGVGDIAQWDNDNGKATDAQGGIFGLHVGVGLKLLLDYLDQSAAGNLEQDIGVINTFLFAEYSLNWIDGFGADDHFNVGDETFMFGLMTEF